MPPHINLFWSSFYDFVAIVLRLFEVPVSMVLSVLHGSDLDSASVYGWWLDYLIAVDFPS